MNFILTDMDSDVTEEIEASSIREALEIAEEWVKDGADPSDETRWVSVRVEYKGPVGPLEWMPGESLPKSYDRTLKIAVDPVAPNCLDGETHDWKSPRSIVGEGVAAHGGGVIYTEVCVKCGTQKTTDTWGHDPVDGEEGLWSVSYNVNYYDIYELLNSKWRNMPLEVVSKDEEGWSLSVINGWYGWFGVLEQGGSEKPSVDWFYGHEKALAELNSRERDHFGPGRGVFDWMPSE